MKAQEKSFSKHWEKTKLEKNSNLGISGAAMWTLTKKYLGHIVYMENYY